MDSAVIFKPSARLPGRTPRAPGEPRPAIPGRLAAITSRIFAITILRPCCFLLKGLNGSLIRDFACPGKCTGDHLAVIAPESYGICPEICTRELSLNWFHLSGIDLSKSRPSKLLISQSGLPRCLVHLVFKLFRTSQECASA
jgi:hypothetical protein